MPHVGNILSWHGCQLFIGIAVLVVPLSGCGKASATGDSGISGSSSASSTVQCTNDQGGVIAVVVDLTSSTQGEVKRPAENLIRRNLKELTTCPERGRRLYVRRVSYDSWLSKNELATSRIPAIDPVHAAECKPQGPFESRQHYAKRMAQCRSDGKRQASQRAQVNATIRSIDQQLARAMSLDPLRKRCPVHVGCTDIEGAFEKFSDIVQDVPGPRYFVIMSDLQEAGPQDSGAHLDMSNTKVLLILSCGTQGGQDAKKCTAAKTYWRQRLLKAKAECVIEQDLSSAIDVDYAFSGTQDKDNPSIWSTCKRSTS